MKCVYWKTCNPIVYYYFYLFELTPENCLLIEARSASQEFVPLLLFLPLGFHYYLLFAKHNGSTRRAVFCSVIHQWMSVKSIK